MGKRLKEASLIGNYDIIRCYEVDITFHYQIDGGLTNSTITHTKAQFSSLFGQASELLNLQSNCSDVVFATKDILSSLPGVKSIFFRIPMIFTAKTNVIDSQVSTKITACISTLTRKYKGDVESKTPSIFQNGTRYNKYNESTISDKRSCCGKNIPPPCCAVGSVKVSSTKCGCAPGFRYAPGFSSSCLRCPSDTYQDEKGQRECKKCPGEKQTFNKTGVSSESHCLDANPLQIHDQVVKFLPENINNQTVVANVTVSAVLSTLVRPFVFYIERVTQQRQYGEMSRRKQRKVEVGSQCIEPGPCPQISVDFCFEAGTVRPENYFCIHRFTGRIRVTQNFVFKEGEEFELQMRVKDSDQRGITENTAVIRLISGDPCGYVNAIYDEAVKYCIKNSESVDGEKRCLSKQCTKAAHDWKELFHNESKVQKKNCSADTHNLANTLREHPRCGSKQLRPLFPAMLLLVTISTSNVAYGGATANRLADLLILILQYM